jgi:hypothetical protein
LEFEEPKPFLIQLRQLARSGALANAPPKIRDLRTNKLKEWREAREAALFCYGMGERIGQTVYFAKSESQDYDFVASWVVGNNQHLAPVQIKEVVPTTLNPQASLESTMRTLTKYADSEDLTVAIHLNQNTRIERDNLRIPPLKLAALWIFATLKPDQSTWGLWGNFLEPDPEMSQFEYPELQPRIAERG